MNSNLRILLVEDNPDHAQLAKLAILNSKDRKYSVLLCTNAEEAMDMIKKEHEPIHLILSDYHLPGKTGIDLLEWLNSEQIRIPFVMMTGAGDEKTAVRAMHGGAYNYLVKDDVYLSVLPHIIDETFLKYLAENEKIRYEREIREKNAALEKANRELKKLDQLKSDFIASVSHDIRTPLNSVQESIALILDGIVDVQQEKGKRVLEIAKRSIGRLGSMINDLLDFSKLEAGKMRLHFELTDIQILIDEVLASVQSLADKKSIKLLFEPVLDFPKCDCDQERLIQVLTNLIGNAIKFTPEKGTVSISTEMDTLERIKITVSDTGIGIAKDDLERIFDQFEQVKGATPKGMKGTGLGLSICKELMKLHHGDVWAESESGKGSHFIVSIPIHQTITTDNVSVIGERSAT